MTTINNNKKNKNNNNNNNINNNNNNNNKLYRRDPKKFFNTLESNSGQKKQIDKPPTKEQVVNLWGRILVSKAMHNNNATWLKEERELMNDKTQSKWIEINIKEFSLTTNI